MMILSRTFIIDCHCAYIEGLELKKISLQPYRILIRHTPIHTTTELMISITGSQRLEELVS